MATRPDPDEVEHGERARVSASEASWALRDANRAAAEVDQVLARRIGMRRLDYDALGHVMTGGHQVGPKQLSERLGISTGSATELVDRLERSGHLLRGPGARDRRRVSLQPTAPAVDRILGELAPLFAALDELADRFTPAELDAIVRYLRGAAAILRDIDAIPSEGPAEP